MTYPLNIWRKTKRKSSPNLRDGKGRISAPYCHLWKTTPLTGFAEARWELPQGC